jgi:hypothetical protein
VTTADGRQLEVELPAGVRPTRSKRCPPGPCAEAWSARRCKRARSFKSRCLRLHSPPHGPRTVCSERPRVAVPEEINARAIIQRRLSRAPWATKAQHTTVMGTRPVGTAPPEMPVPCCAAKSVNDRGLHIY